MFARALQPMMVAQRACYDALVTCNNNCVSVRAYLILRQLPPFLFRYVPLSAFCIWADQSLACRFTGIGTFFFLKKDLPTSPALSARQTCQGGSTANKQSLLFPGLCTRPPTCNSKLRTQKSRRGTCFLNANNNESSAHRGKPVYNTTHEL